MDDRESRTKWAPAEFWEYRHGNDDRRSPLAGERHILKLISLGAPLPGILNKLCSAIDVEIGKVVSIVLLPDAEGIHLSCSISQSATQFGLNSFSFTRIFSHDKILLGTLQIYCCDQRRPTPNEYQLIERVAHLAGIALQRHKDAKDCETSTRVSRRVIGGNEPETPPFIN
jgi:hypothetical protein